MRVSLICAALALASCERPAHQPSPSAAPAATTMSEAERALRAQTGTYYFDFIKMDAFKRYAPNELGLSAKAAKRFERVMAVATPSLMVEAHGAAALVFSGCVQHDCGDTAGVLAIDAASQDIFVGVRDDAGADVLKSNERLQKLLEDTSPSHRWSNPAH